MERDKAETSRDIGWRVNGSPSHRQSWLAAKPTIDNFAGRLSGVGTPSDEILGSGKRTPHVHAFTAGSEQATWVFRDFLRKHHGVAQQYSFNGMSNGR
ncbi:hypothetical protein [Serratia ureilytica]|uniref:hypothetical protein n=1 Tax=Serratia ureilytica TaxID=300181 RepID=UPI0018D6763A|nr:hypothetical protein [Serratia ureilytica]MBH3092121.1 hypothetical protein [Serratia ureilytica]